MNCKTPLLAVAMGAAALALVAREPTTIAQETSQQTTTTTTRTISGSVVRYTPGQMIVLKGPDGKMTTYMLTSSVEAPAPAEVQVGKTVTISTEPATDGSGTAVVKRIVTTTVDSEGRVKTTKEKTEYSPSGTTTSSMTEISGTVTAIMPGQSISIQEPGKELVTYTVDKDYALPADVVVGKTVTVKTTRIAGIKLPVVRHVTVTTVTKSGQQ
jgi:hypothetical protein